MSDEPPLALFHKWNVSRESLDKLKIYVATLQEWQPRINLVGPATMQEVWSRHITDSLQLLPYMQGENRLIADLGSGAGFPGLVLAVGSAHQVQLYESNGKKVAFLREVIRKTGANAVVYQQRLEELAAAPAQRVDYVTARALAPLPKLLEWAAPFLTTAATALFHKGQDVDNELTAAAKSWRMVASKHTSVVDSRGVILEIKELSRV